jgi:hypothetical protein
MVDPLLDREVQRLIIESRQGRDQRDRKVAHRGTRPPRPAPTVSLRAPAAARQPASVGRRRLGLESFRRRYLASAHRGYHRGRGRVAAVDGAKPRRSPSGEEPGPLPEAQRDRQGSVWASSTRAPSLANSRPPERPGHSRRHDEPGYPCLVCVPTVPTPCPHGAHKRAVSDHRRPSLPNHETAGQKAHYR